MVPTRTKVAILGVVTALGFAVATTAALPTAEAGGRGGYYGGRGDYGRRGYYRDRDWRYRRGGGPVYVSPNPYRGRGYRQPYYAPPRRVYVAPPVVGPRVIIRPPHSRIHIGP